MNHDILTSTFLRLRSRLLASARGLLANEGAADDALQEAFYKLWARRESIVSRSQAEGLSVVAVRNTCIDALRRSSHLAEQPLDQTAECIEDSDGKDARSELYDAVKRIIDSRLSERERMVLTMRDSQGIAFADIADELGITEANARMILSRARKCVRETYLSSIK